MKNQNTLDTLVEMEDEDLIVLFERLSQHVSQRERSFRTALRNALFPQKRLRKHQDKLGGCRTFIAQNGFITLHHAKEAKLIEASTASATWLRCFVKPLTEEGIIEEYALRWKGPNTRGTGMKVYARPGSTPSLFAKSISTGYSLVDNPTGAARVLVEYILSKPTYKKKGFPENGRFETVLKSTKLKGSPLFRDVNEENIRNWLDTSVRKMLNTKMKQDPSYEVYNIHGSKITVGQEVLE